MVFPRMKGNRERPRLGGFLKRPGARGPWESEVYPYPIPPFQRQTRAEKLHQSLNGCEHGEEGAQSSCFQWSFTKERRGARVEDCLGLGAGAGAGACAWSENLEEDSWARGDSMLKPQRESLGRWEVKEEDLLEQDSLVPELGFREDFIPYFGQFTNRNAELENGDQGSGYGMQDMVDLRIGFNNMNFMNLSYDVPSLPDILPPSIEQYEQVANNISNFKRGGQRYLSQVGDGGEIVDEMRRGEELATGCCMFNFGVGGELSYASPIPQSFLKFSNIDDQEYIMEDDYHYLPQNILIRQPTPPLIIAEQELEALFNTAREHLSEYNNLWTAILARPSSPLSIPYPSPPTFNLQTLLTHSPDIPSNLPPSTIMKWNTLKFFCLPFNCLPIWKDESTGSDTFLVMSDKEGGEKVELLRALKKQLMLEMGRWHEDRIRGIFRDREGDGDVEGEGVKDVWSVVVGLKGVIEEALG